jgi:two-component system, NarL family, nitrate/nitrite response regulator NarL
MFRAGLAAALHAAEIEVVAEVSTRAGAVSAAMRLCPGVCLLDENLRGGAIATIKRIAETSPETLVVVLGASVNPDHLVAAVRAGAAGYLPRSTSTRGLARAVNAVLADGVAIPRAGVNALIREVRANGRQRTVVGGSQVSLTEREATVLDRLRDGLDTRQIADELGLSPVTVRRHLGAVAIKVGIPGRAALLRGLRAS